MYSISKKSVFRVNIKTRRLFQRGFILRVLEFVCTGTDPGGGREESNGFFPDDRRLRCTTGGAVTLNKQPLYL